jgi:pimeloyl-ACP methyl ester carboxylesterase
VTTDVETTEIEWLITKINDRTAHYGRVGEGPPLVFLHGWGLSGRAYSQALLHIARQGVSVYAPSLPGFGGTAALPEATLETYAGWVGDFLNALWVDEPVIAMGHSFGGGVAIQFAHDLPDRVRSLVLVNSIGGGLWRAGDGRTMADRPWWDWSLQLPFDVLRPPRLRVVPILLRDYARNVIRNPRGMARAGQIARAADLTSELEELRRRRLPIVVLWGEADRIIPQDSLDALLDALGNPEPVKVAGAHSWMLADPDDFGELMTNVL